MPDKIQAHLLEGEFRLQLTGNLSELTLGHWETRLGRFTLLGEPEYQLTFPSPVSPLQAGVSVKFLEWQLPRIGPFIISTVSKGALDVVQGHGFELKPSLGGEIKLARIPWLTVEIESDVKITYSPGTGAHVEPLGAPEVKVMFDVTDIVRRIVR
jgi:hypothetical protein